MNEVPYIPYDMYESLQELIIVMPLWWVKKETLQLKIEDYRLLISGEREYVSLKESLIAVKEECYWGRIEQIIDLPAQVYFDKIHSKLTLENVLIIIVPKAKVPETIDILIEE